MKFFKNIAFPILGFIGLLTACSQNEKTLAYYEIYGTVVDSISSLPLIGMRVIREATEYLLFPDTLYTDSVGKYQLSFTDYYSKKPEFTIKVEDKDGNLNGGDFATRKLKATFLKSDWVNLVTDGEYYGTAVKTIDIKLQMK